LPRFATYEDQGAIRVITMNMPERLNALNVGLMKDVNEAVETFLADEQAAVAVLTGAGRGFCSGQDRKEALEMMEMPPGPERQARHDEWGRVYDRFKELVMRRDGAKPLVTAINGPAVGGGLGVALAGWLRVAASSAYLQEVGLHIGADLAGFVHSPLAPCYGTLAETEYLPPVIEHEFVLGMRISAERAHQFGLVNRVVADDKVVETALEYAAHMASLPMPLLSQLVANMREQQRVRRPELAGKPQAPRNRDTESRRQAAKAFVQRSRG
jgi:enoyl-CoA hydratase/carnithine racemase